MNCARNMPNPNQPWRYFMTQQLIYIDLADLTAYTFDASGRLMYQHLRNNNSFFPTDSTKWEPVDPADYVSEKFLDSVRAILNDEPNAVDPNDEN